MFCPEEQHNIYLSTQLSQHICLLLAHQCGSSFFAIRITTTIGLTLHINQYDLSFMKTWLMFDFSLEISCWHKKRARHRIKGRQVAVVQGLSEPLECCKGGQPGQTLQILRWICNICEHMSELTFPLNRVYISLAPKNLLHLPHPTQKWRNGTVYWSVG